MVVGDVYEEEGVAAGWNPQVRGEVVCIHMYICTYKYTWMYTHYTHMYICTYKYTWMYALCIHMHARAHACACRLEEMSCRRPAGATNHSTNTPRQLTATPNHQPTLNCQLPGGGAAPVQEQEPGRTAHVRTTAATTTSLFSSTSTSRSHSTTSGCSPSQ